MSFQATLDASPDSSLEMIEEYLEDELLDDLGGYLPRVEPDFDENDRYDVFVQTEDYNVFLTEESLQFHGLNPEGVKVGWAPESEAVWDYLEEEYLEEEETLEEYLQWR
jgi:hypothetical protein